MQGGDGLLVKLERYLGEGATSTTVESERDLAGLRRVGRVVALALKQMREALEPGMMTTELDDIGVRVFEGHGARFAPQLIYAFPGVNCISVNDEAVHGVPGERIVEPGDLVNIDATAELDGFIADAAVTVAVPAVHGGLRYCAEYAFRRAAADRAEAPSGGPERLIRTTRSA